MTRFIVGRPVKTRLPTVSVDGGLKPGLHRFQLVVLTADGRTSQPDVEVVKIFDGPGDPIRDDPIRRE